MSSSTFLKHDLLILLSLLLGAAIIMAVIWYAEERSGAFSQAAAQLLDYLVK